jgi:hypothetical protein
MSETTESYKNLCDELRSNVTELTSLYSERTALQEQLEQLQTASQTIADQLFETRRNQAAAQTERDKPTLQTKLQQVDTDLRTTEATLAGANTAITALEVRLHSSLHDAGEPFRRLWQALRNHTLQVEVGTLLARISSSRSPQALRPLAEQLAEQSTAVAEVVALEPPGTGSWYTSQPLPTDAEPRQTVMRAAVDLTNKLCSAGESLIALAGANADLTVPSFVAATATAPGFADSLQARTPPELPELGALDPEELAYVNELCRTAGKSLAELTDNDKAVLANSLENHRKGRFLIPGVVNLDLASKTTGPDSQIEQLRAAGKL